MQSLSSGLRRIPSDREKPHPVLDCGLLVFAGWVLVASLLCPSYVMSYACVFGSVVVVPELCFGCVSVLPWFWLGRALGVP